MKKSKKKSFFGEGLFFSASDFSSNLRMVVKIVINLLWTYEKLHFKEISLGRVVVPSPKTVINIPRKLYCEGEQYQFSIYRDPSLHTKTNIHPVIIAELQILGLWKINYILLSLWNIICLSIYLLLKISQTVRPISSPLNCIFL